ncbi:MULTISPECIES: hypothetical protein [Elizabethkingia]|uniref:hypothetical protein n=1 Tax=Elizabethkingia TaxID=308865 RepID=UPI0016273D34|nr:MULTISPECIES: hypothetical protein [Elizabethkingia]MDV3885263.1 hypothetical protein [Elizabethkingia anophelis]MDX8576822.1 hypothetical protein [Elizabethkingia sp. HX WYD]HCZ8396917.1 hypothetical protein [Elizabethkingia anophelis]
MTKKIFYSLYGLIICLFIIGCVRDERDAVSSANIPNDVTTKAYVKLSPWNENEAFIKNVRSSFIKNIDLEKFKNEYGSVFWDYTISFPNVQEAGLAIPVVKNNDVVAVLKATFKDNRINLKWVNDEDPKEFFRSLIFKDKSRQSYAQGIGKSIRNGLSASIDQVAVMEYKCIYKTISIGCPNDQTDCPPMSRTVSECSWIETGGQDFESIAPPDGGGGGGGGGDGGADESLFPDKPSDMFMPPPPKKPILDIKKFLSCFDQSKSANLTVYAQNMLASPPGHAFITIQQGNNIMTFGFYPRDPYLNSLSGRGIMGEDDLHSYNQALNVGTISPAQLQQIISRAIDYASTRYDLAVRNCADFAREALNIANVPGANWDSNWLRPTDIANIINAQKSGVMGSGTSPVTQRTCNN